MSAPRIDTRKVAEQRELQVLRLVRQFGHLRRRDIAQALWRDSDLRTAAVMAQRTCARLIAGGELEALPNQLQSESLLLTRRGSHRLSEPHIKVHPRSVMCAQTFSHTSIAARYLAQRFGSGAVVAPEHALLSGMGPVTVGTLADAYCKRPDGLIFEKAVRADGARVWHVDWLEVEHAYKPPAELDRVLDLARHLGTIFAWKRDLIFDRIIFAYAPGYGHERRIAAAIRRYERVHGENEILRASLLTVPVETAGVA